MRKKWTALLLALSLVVFPLSIAEETQSKQPKATETDLQPVGEEHQKENQVTESEAKEEKQKELQEEKTELTSRDETALDETTVDAGSTEQITDTSQNAVSSEQTNAILTENDIDEQSTDMLPETEEPAGEDENSLTQTWDGEMIYGSWAKASFDKETKSLVYHIKIDRSVDALLQTEGLAVSLTVTTLENVVLHEFRPLYANNQWVPIEAELHLKRGEYLVHIQKINSDEEGICRLILTQQHEIVEEESQQIEESDSAELETTQDVSEGEGEEVTDTFGESTNPEEGELKVKEDTVALSEEVKELAADEEKVASEESDETNDPEDKAKETDESNRSEENVASVETKSSDNVENDEATVIDEQDTAKEPETVQVEDSYKTEEYEVEKIEETKTDDPEESDTGENLLDASDMDLSVKVVASFEDTSNPGIGTVVILTAELTGCDPETVFIEWQYSPDGGETIVTVENAHDIEYHYTLDWENRNYFWRVVVTRITEEPIQTER